MGAGGWYASARQDPLCSSPPASEALKPTKPAIQISDADRKRRILITDKCTMAPKKWRGKGESLRVGALKVAQAAGPARGLWTNLGRLPLLVRVFLNR